MQAGGGGGSQFPVLHGTQALSTRQGTRPGSGGPKPLKYKGCAFTVPSVKGPVHSHVLGLPLPLTFVWETPFLEFHFSISSIHGQASAWHSRPLGTLSSGVKPLPQPSISTLSPWYLE